MDNMSLSDIAAIMPKSGNGDGFLEGNGIIILILFFLIFGFGGGALVLTETQAHRLKFSADSTPKQWFPSSTESQMDSVTALMRTHV